MRAALVAVIAAAGLLLLPGTAARADADSGTGSGGGSGGDGSLQLIPEVITNSGIRAGGSTDFPVKAQLFLPAMAQRALDRDTAQETIMHAVGAIGFERQANPFFTQDYSETRDGLFADYAPQSVPSATPQSNAETNDLWVLLMLVAAIPLTFLAVYLGRKNASRRMNRHGRTAH